MKDLSTRFVLATVCALFVLAGLAVLPYPGIQNDEALFANPIYQNSWEFKIRIGHQNFPVMVMSYIGTLKTLVFWFVWRIFPPSLYSLRLPVILAGALTIFVFFWFCRRIAPEAAWLATLLLATDPSFLLTDTFDWGPDAIQHVLLVTGCFLVVRFGQDGASRHRHRDLALGFACFGLGIWDKAIFLWSLGGVGIATVVVCRREVRALVSTRAAAFAAAGLLIGALPFVIYNVKRPNATIGGNARIEMPDWHAKALQVRSALDGSALFGYIAADEPGPVRQPLTSLKGRCAAWIHSHLGEHRTNGMYLASLICLALVPLWWSSRVAWFAIVATVATWLVMALTRDGGTATHHVVLLWPFPQLFVAAVVMRIPWKGLALALGALLCVMNLLVLNQYLWQLEQYGAGQPFTDAITVLSERLDAHRNDTIYVLDWGMQNSVAMLHRGQLKLEVADGPFESDHPGETDVRERAQMFTNPNGLIVWHSPGREYFQGVRERFDKQIAAAGLHKSEMEVVTDLHGRPEFEMFRLAGGQATAAAR